MTFNESPQPDTLTLEAVKIQLDRWRATRGGVRQAAFKRKVECLLGNIF